MFILGIILVDDRDVVFCFVEEDFSGLMVCIVVVDEVFVCIVIDFVVYGVKVIDDYVGMIENVNKRWFDDYIYDVVEVCYWIYFV